MNKKLLIGLGVLILLVAGVFSFTGFVTFSTNSADIQIVRAPLETEDGITYVTLSIVGSEFMIGISEELVSDTVEDCFVYYSWTYPVADVFVPSVEMDPVWIFADDEARFDLEMTYAIPEGCVPVEDGGEVFVFGEGEKFNQIIESGESGLVSDPFNLDGPGSANPSTDSSGGGSSSSNSDDSSSSSSEDSSGDSQEVIETTQIVQAKSLEEYESLNDVARKTFGLAEGEEFEKGSFSLIIIFSLIGIAIVLFIVVALVRRPKNQFE